MKDLSVAIEDILHIVARPMDDDAVFNNALDAIHERLLRAGWVSRILQSGDRVTAAITPLGAARIGAIRGALAELGYSADDLGGEVEPAVLFATLMTLDDQAPGHGHGPAQ